MLLARAGLHGGGPSARTGTVGPVTGASRPAVQTQLSTATATRAVTRAATPRYATVQKGDTFGSIAAKAGTSVSALERLNPGVSSTALQVGQRIRVK